jgi:hypothetical protein
LPTTRKPRIGQADLAAAKAEGIASGRKEGAAAEHERLVAIMTLPEAVNRQNSALALALAGPPVLTVAQARAVLITVPEDAKPVEPAQAPAPNSKNLFEAAMERDNPDLGTCDVIGDPWTGVRPSSREGQRQ